MHRSQAFIADAREAFVVGGVETEGLRPGVIEAWRRSKAAGVTPDAPVRLHTRDFDADSALLRASSPIVSSLVERLSGVDAAMVVMDREARIVGRWASSKRMDSLLQRMSPGPGGVFDEAVVGSTGLGTAFELVRPSVVEGTEHYRSAFDSVVAVGVPVFNPGTGVIEGAIDLVAPVGSPVSLIVPLVAQTASQVNLELLSGYARQDRDLLAEFVAANARFSPAPIVALNGRVVMANPAGRAVISAVEHFELWEPVRRAFTSRERYVTLKVGSRELAAVIARVSSTDIRAGAILRFVEPDRTGDATAGASISTEPLHTVQGGPAGLTYLQLVERRAIAELLDAAGGNRVAVARELGISHSTLYRKLAALELDRSIPPGPGAPVSNLGQTSTSSAPS